MAKKEVTKAPTGLSVVRSEDKFTASWKIGDKDYADGQYFQYAIDNTGKISWLPTKNTAIGTKTASRVITTINKSNYYPNTDSEGNNKPFLYNICFRVKGNRKKYTTRSGRKKKTHSPSASAWVRKDFVVNPPKKPILIAKLDEELTNVCTFSWNAPYESNDSYIFTDVQWQTIFVKNSSEADGSKLDWSNAEEGVAGAEGSKTLTEDTSILYKDGNSYTRWFRARSRGPRGVYDDDGSNGWVYEKHVYALSHQADVTGTSASETEEGGFQCTVDWTAGQSGGQNPIDKTIAQYTITTPDKGLTCPSGASWKNANISRDTEAGDAAVFGIDDQLGKDQCLFIRVNTQHDNNITYGKPQLSYVGFLKDPSGLSVSTDNVTHKATITATNNSAVEDSILIVRYVPSSGDPIDVGVIPHGSTSVTVQCPNWDDQKAIAFDVYAIVGTVVKQTRADGVDSYSVTVGMRSQNTVSEGGAVPVAPKNVSVSRVEGKSDTVRVDWDWPWSEAGSAEISWSDHDDAWESTDEPESFLISNLHASHWNISGLETGKTWYVRVRLIAGNMATSENVTYGPWSDVSQGTIDLSSAPNKPVLILSNSVIPEDGSTIASWVYTTTDNTAQAYAEVAIVENGEYIPIAHSLTAQHVTIPAQSENYTLYTGNIYNLVCRVKSASGKLSEWSDIVSLTVAEPITCEIVQTSLVRQRIETNPREFGPDGLLTFETELEEGFAKLQANLEPTQEGSGTPSPSNVRPIRGHSGVDVNVGGKNWFDSSLLKDQEGWNTFDVHLKPNTIYTMSSNLPQAKTSELAAYFIQENISPSSTTIIYAGHSFTVTTPSDGIVQIQQRRIGGTDSFQNYEWQIELGSTATPYEPYQQPQTTTQDFNVSLTPTSTDTTPYLFKAVGDVYGDRLEDKIVGGTIAWNQLARYIASGAPNGITYTWNKDGSYTLNGTATENSYRFVYNGIPANHVSLLEAVSSSDDVHMWFAGYTNTNKKRTVYKPPASYGVCLYVPSGVTLDNVKVYPQVHDLTQMFGSTIADYIYSLEQSQAGAGVAWFKKLFPNDYYAYNAGKLLSVEGLQSHNTVGFNQWDEEWEVGGLTWATGQPAELTDRWRSKNFCKCLPDTNYYVNRAISIFFYDAEQNFISYNGSPIRDRIITTPINCHYFKVTDSSSTTYNHDTCINLSNPTRNGEYEPYEKHSYPLDSSLTLRGIPKLDASNNLYYDGDEYTSDGKVKRKYGVVDLGTLDWSTNGGEANRFRAEPSPAVASPTTYNDRLTGFICSKYPPSTNYSLSDIDNECMVRYGGEIFVRDSAYTDAATFKAAMSGVMLVYELATPTTETATPYTNPQIVSKYGTLEYVTNSIVPVGHKTTYLTRDIFGGYVDLISGKLVVDKVSVDLGSLEWVYQASGTLVAPYMYATVKNLGIKRLGAFGTTVHNIICSKYTTVARNTTAFVDKTICADGDAYAVTQIQIKDSSYTNATTFKSAMNGVQLVYELATPQAYQLTPQQVNTLVGTNNVWSDSGQVEVRIAESMRDVDTLTKMPLSIKVTGAGDGGITTVVVERAEDYLMVRPDETNFNGNKGEMVLQTSPPLVGINQVSFNTEDLIGPMDDGAVYNIVATVQDGLRQKDSVTLPFEVHWEHQAEEPSAEVVIDEENLIAYIKPIAPANADPEDVADIYRLSADKPELIVEGAIFGETYVDPYPALGDMGGHRIVTRTKNGDYITEGNQIAMIDSPELGVNPIENEDLLNVIDFEGRQIRFYWETDYSNTWAKDFQETTYLGGSIEGDWNPAVSRSGTLSSKAITVLDQEMLKDVRRLADYPGICHVRTADGSSYAADVQVSEDYTDDEKGMVTNYSLSITKVGSQGFDGMTKEQWDDENPVEVEEEV